MQSEMLRHVALTFASVLISVTLATTSHAAKILATGPGPGHPPLVKVIVFGTAGNDTISFMAYQSNFMGGVRVAVGDVNGDGQADIITGSGAGASGHIKVFDGTRLGQRTSLLMSFSAFPGFFRGGVFVAAGDVNGDGRADIIVAPDSGAPPLVRVFDGKTGNLIRSFFAYAPTFIGGVRVAAGDVNNDGFDDVIVGAGAGGFGGHVKVFSGSNGAEVQSFLAFPGFSGGVFVGSGDVNGDGFDDVIVGADAGAPGGHVKVFDGGSNALIASFLAFPGFSGGVRVAAGDVNGDNFADIITGAGAGAPGGHVKVFSGSTDLLLLHSFFAYEPNFLGGVFVAGRLARGRR